MIYLFDNKENLIKVVRKSDVLDAVQTMEINKTITLDCSFKADFTDEMNSAEYVGHYYKDVFYMYRIINVGRSNSVYTMQAIHVVFEELKAYGYIRDLRPSDMSVGQALIKLLDGSRWSVGIVESEKVGSSNWYDLSRFEALADLISKWDVELDYRIGFDGYRILNRYIDVYDKLGHDTGRRFVYGTNALTITSETTKASVYTALIGRGKGEEKTDENGEATGGYGRRINFADVEWSVVKGDPVDKPLGQEYVELQEATKAYGFSDGVARTKIEVFEDCDDKEELLRLTYQALVNYARPLVTFSATVEKIGSVQLGDTVRIIRRDYNLFYTARIFKIERNLINDMLTKVELGDYIPSNSEKNRVETKNKLEAASSAIQQMKVETESKVNKLLSDIKSGIELQYFNDQGFNYELANNNKWGLPAGYYSFDRAIDNDPTKVIFVGSGKIMIANKKLADGSWDWSTFGTGDGFTADLVNAGHIRGTLIEAGSITSNQLATGAITSNKIAAGAITSDKISARGITADKIQAGTITANEIRGNTITNSEIAGRTITGDEVDTYTLSTEHMRELKVDILRPGSNNRIIFEGNSPGDNDVKSIDATGDAVRLKYDASNYVYANSGSIQFYTSSGMTQSRGSNLYADNISTTSDIRRKENVKYIDHEASIKPNSNVEIPAISSKEIYDFVKNINLATYNYIFSDKPQLSIIAQNAEQYDKIKDYVVVDDGFRKYLNNNNLNAMHMIATKKIINIVDGMSAKIDELEKQIEELRGGSINA